MDLVAKQYNNRLNALAIAGGWLFLFLVTVFAYWPGLGGPFVLDDEGSIGALGRLGGVVDWQTFTAYVFGGNTGPTGRPVALLSFLIDGNTWPTDPWPFKRTNLAIHLINAALLGVLIVKILRLLNIEKRNALWIALLATAGWVLHPFLVSTTLYAVQRMAQLSTLFVLAGLIGHLYGRSLLLRSTTKAYWVMATSLSLFTLLALLSKENGILLPLLVGVVEFTVIASRQDQLPKLNRYWAMLFIVMPSLAIVAYLAVKVIGYDFFEIVPPRDFSIYERVLTQPRILLDYFQHWFVPKLYTTGVFQDHFIKSTGVFSPVTTILSFAVHITILSVAIANRRKWPLAALAALFFYASHVLESTVLNLELYFEHRNYLATAFLALPVFALMQRKLSRQLFLFAAIGILLVLASFTRYSATIWQDFPSMVEASARKAPTSARAQAQYATILFNAQRYEESLQVLDRAIEVIPTNSPLLLVNRMIILCNLSALNNAEVERVARALSEVAYDVRLMNLYTSFTSSVATNSCPDTAMRTLRTMYTGMLGVPHNANAQSLEFSHLNYLAGMVDVYLGEPLDAVAAFEKSLLAEAGANHAMMMAALLATHEYYDEALYLSELALSHLHADQDDALRATPITEQSIKSFQEIVRVDQQAADSTASGESPGD
jgi:tetratricopeptide (TPR) repeat protein